MGLFDNAATKTSLVGGLTSLFGNNQASSQSSNEQEAIDMLKKQMAMAEEGFTDSNGNTIKYVKGKGWVTTMKNKADSARAANNQSTNMKMASENTQAADAMSNLSSEDITNILSGANRTANTDALNKTTSAALRSAGTGSNAGSILSGLTQGAQTNMADADANARAEALLNGGTINTNRTSPYIQNASNLTEGYNNTTNNLNSMTGLFAGNAANAGTSAANATATQSTPMNTVGKIGSAFQGIGTSLTDQNKTAQNKKQIDYFTSLLNSLKTGSY